MKFPTTSTVPLCRDRSIKTHNRPPETPRRPRSVNPAYAALRAIGVTRRTCLRGKNQPSGDIDEMRRRISGFTEPLGIAGQSVSANVNRQFRLYGLRAQTRACRATSASAPIPDTTSTAGRAQASRPRPAGDGPGCADQLPNSSGTGDRRPRARASRREALPDRGRPQHVAVGRKPPIPSINDGLGGGSRTAFPLRAAGTSLNGACSTDGATEPQTPSGARLRSRVEAPARGRGHSPLTAAIGRSSRSRAG